MRKAVDPALVVGFSISTILAVATAVLPAGNQATLLSLIVGTLGAAITLQIDTILRLERRYAKEDARMGLWVALQRAPDLQDDATRIIDLAADTFESAHPPAFGQAARDAVARCRDSLAEIAAGRLQSADGDITPLSEQLGQTKSSVKATTLARFDEGWWSSPSGLEYLDGNRAAVGRGVFIERIIIAENDDCSDASEIIRLNLEANVRTMIVPQSRVPAHIVRNMAIFDDRYLIEDVLDGRGAIVAYQHSLQAADLSSATSAFAQLKTLSSLCPRP